MFTLLVSWLLVICVPGLLMLAAHGLGRLEKDLGHDTVTAIDVDDDLEHTEAIDVRALAREGMPEALEYLHRRQARRLPEWPPAGADAGPRHSAPVFAADFADPGTAGLPTRIHTHSPINPQFGATRHVDRV
ncbi:hypothetical protein [Mycobacterium sp.]|uniref:hypothetical protein n=1 Tax=Mycobacterium sp. TaxID=1785 RepID=UPI003C74E2F7